MFEYLHRPAILAFTVGLHLLLVPPGWTAESVFPNNVRIQTTDTPALYFDQTAGAHPAQVWQLGGFEQSFFIYDQTANVTPFEILTGALQSTMVIGTGGLVGIGTDVPAANLHIQDALLASLRLDTVGNVGTAARAYELNSTTIGFQLLDLTSATSPILVESATPTNTLVMTSIGRIGLGTAAPTSKLHLLTPAVVGSESIAKFEVSDDPIGSLQINNVSSGNGIFHPRLLGSTAMQAVALTMEGRITSDVGSNPVVAYDAARLGGGTVTTRPLVVYRNNTVIKASIAANGNLTATSFITASSRSLKDNIVDLDSRKAQDALRQLTPVEFVYKDDPTADHRVGFIAEDVPEIIAEADRKSVPIMDIVALVTRVVKDQQKTIDEQKKSIEEQGKMIDALMKRLSQLEGQMQEKK